MHVQILHVSSKQRGPLRPSKEIVIDYVPGAVSKGITVKDCATKCNATLECSALQYHADKQFCKLIQARTSQDIED